MSDSWDSSDCSPPGSSVHSISQSRILEWVAIFFSRESSWPPSPALAGGFFTTEPPSVQLLSRVQHLETLWTAVHQASLSITNSQSLLKLMSIDSVMPSNHLILCHLFSSCLQSFWYQDLFQWVSSSNQVAKGLDLQHQSFQWIFRTDFL